MSAWYFGSLRNQAGPNPTTKRSASPQHPMNINPDSSSPAAESVSSARTPSIESSPANAKLVRRRTAGGATGAVVGALVGGPLGALVGGALGVVVGGASATPRTRRKTLSVSIKKSAKKMGRKVGAAAKKARASGKTVRTAVKATAKAKNLIGSSARLGNQKRSPRRKTHARH